jgi:hypothetical protein
VKMERAKPHDQRMRDLVGKVDEILLHEWDPVGVRDNPRAWDEYSSYAPGLLRFAMRGDVEAVADRLHRIKHELMGLRREDRALDRAVARKIVDLAAGISDPAP